MVQIQFEFIEIYIFLNFCKTEQQPVPTKEPKSPKVTEVSPNLESVTTASQDSDNTTPEGKLSILSERGLCHLFYIFFSNGNVIRTIYCFRFF